MSRKLLLLSAALALDLTTAGAQGASVARPIFSSDSVEVMGSPIVSPNERWLVFVRGISNQESRVMIQPFAGGELRELVQAKGFFYNLRFTPRGDRLVMVSDQPRRGPADNQYYLVGAPFDSRTGTLTAPVRQIALDAVDNTSIAISPDGQWVAYLEGVTRVLKIVPITGGNSRTLADKERRPAALAWTPDGRSVLYETREGDEFIRKRVSREGGPPVVVLRSKQTLGVLTPDNRYSVALEIRPPATPRILHVFAPDGQQVGEVTIPSGILIRPSGFSVNGKYILGSRSNAVAPIKVVPVAGGPIQQITKGDVYDWAGSWTANSESLYVWTEEKGRSALALVSRDGKSVSRTTTPELMGVRTLGEQDGFVVLLEGGYSGTSDTRLMALNLKDGSRKELASGVRRENTILGPGGMYYGLYNGEAYYLQSIGGRVQARATNLQGVSRLIGELPADRADRSGVAVFQARMVYSQAFKDSVRLQLVAGPGQKPTTLGTFPNAAAPREISWSYDGRQLTTYLGGAPQTQLVYQFDAAGAVQGAPLSFTLPFEYYYEVFWLPDGSGLTMIAQPRGRATSEVALVKLADPMHPILLTQDDPRSKWGHSLSPDGKHVAYASQESKGSSIYLIDVAELIKQASGRR